jgi:predicted Zn-dependent protease with MMP-like domain
MVEVSNERFQELINQALGELPGEHVKNIKNVAILYEEEPSQERLARSNVLPGQTLLGQYEGVPLSERQGMTRVLPDKITLFKAPLSWRASDEAQLVEEIKHTLWHEIAHYYGLGHKRIHELE